MRQTRLNFKPRRPYFSVTLPTEIMYLIISAAAVLPDSRMARLSLLRFTTTCRDLSPFALDLLWANFQHSLIPLLHTFPPSSWEIVSSDSVVSFILFRCYIQSLDLFVLAEM